VIRVVRLAEVPAQPWKNGGGTTRELLAWPAAAHWAVRLSVARIDSDGPFSAYPGITRWFAVLSGGGVELRWPHCSVQVGVGTAPLHFEGADAPGCRLLAGPTEDLNLMLRNGQVRGALRPVLGGVHANSHGGWRGVYTAADCTLHGSVCTSLPAHSLAWDDAATAPWQLSSTAPIRAWWLELELVPS
jgi:environmental stress-induced protein Ves